MRLCLALRVCPKEVIALVGGGGKTTIMFRLADELAAEGWRVVSTMTTKIFVGQMARAPGRLTLQGEGALLARLPQALSDHGHVLVAGSTIVEQDKVDGPPPELVDRIAAHPAVDAVIIEADGSRRLPFKAPAAHEPVIPHGATLVVPVVGLDVLGHPLAAEHVHRPQLVAALASASPGDPVTPEMVAAVLRHPDGGGKGVPHGARLVPLLNKAEDSARLGGARRIARLLLASRRVDSVVIGAAEAPEPALEVWSRIGAVILAAGAARRFGALKQVLPWRGVPMVAHVARQALECEDVSRIVVTVGARADEVRAALAQGLGQQSAVEAGASPWAGDGAPPRGPAVAAVPDWEAGQSRSVLAGLEAIGAMAVGEGVSPLPDLGAVLFLLADQPGMTPELLSALIRRHRETQAPVVAPRYLGQRGNPVLFDRVTFPRFSRLVGDVGARPIIESFREQIAWVDWPTPEVVTDIDTAGDYRAEDPMAPP